LHDPLDIALLGIGAVCRQVEDPIGPDVVQAATEPRRIAEVGFVKPDAVEHLLEAPRVVTAADQQVDLMAIGEQAADQVGPDEAGAAGDEGPLAQDRAATIT